MRERRLLWRLCLFVNGCLSVSGSWFRRLPAVISECINGLTVVSSITTALRSLFILCVCLCLRWVVQSESIFPLFLLIMTDSIRKQLQEIELGIHDDVINLPIDLCEEELQQTRFSLIAKPVNPRRQNLRAMLNAGRWRRGGWPDSRE